MSKNKSLRKEVRALKKAVGRSRPELREVTSEVAATSISTSGSLVELTQLSSGDDNQTSRLGSDITLKQMILRYIIAMGATTHFGGTYVRYMVVRSKIGPLSSSDFPSTYYGAPNHNKFYVLKDVLTDLAAQANNGSGTNVGFTHSKVLMNKKYKTLKIRYLDAGATAQDNGIYLWMLTGSDGPTYAGYHVMKYYDN